MACCGKKDPLPGGPAARTANPALIGQNGMTLLTYQGGNYGDESYYGPATGTRYVFSMANATKLVDDRDLSTPNGRGLLQLFENGHFIFRRTHPRPLAPAEPPPVELLRNDPPPEPAPRPDDLTQIAGVGAQTAAKLAQLGLTTFRAVAKMNPERVAVVLGIPKTRLEKIAAAAGDLVHVTA